jgi:transcriptional regulator with XRE-family HTH domain
MIQAARKAKGWTRQDLAAAISVSVNAIGAWERGWTYPQKNADALEEALGVRLPGPRCGRPEDHNGPCRALEAVERANRASTARQAGLSRPCACECGEVAVRGRRYKRGHGPQGAGRDLFAPVAGTAGQQQAA